MFRKSQYIQAGTVSPSTLSLTKTGRINLNRHFVKRYGLHQNMSAELYWDEIENKIAIIIVEKGQAGAFPLVFVPNGQAAYIIAAQFFRSVRIDPEKYATAYEFEVRRPEQLGINGEVGEAFTINLTKPIS